MKKYSLIITLMVLCLFAGKAISAMPVYTDELPDSYIESYKDLKDIDYKQALPLYNTEKSMSVKIYSPKKIELTPITEKKDGIWVYHQNYDLNDKVTFIVAEDVIKDDSVYIKKGTEVVGLIRVAQIGWGQLSSPDEIQISMFSTTDVNEKKVPLYGTVANEGKELGFFSNFFFNIPSCKAKIPKNKVFTVYAKK